MTAEMLLQLNFHLSHAYLIDTQLFFSGVLQEIAVIKNDSIKQQEIPVSEDAF